MDWMNNANFFWPWILYGGVGGSLFLQQESHCFDARVGMEAADHTFFAQVVDKREQDLSLVMCHVGMDNRTILASHKPVGSKICRLI